jgi:hypothetical protein
MSVLDRRLRLVHHRLIQHKFALNMKSRCLHISPAVMGSLREWCSFETR